jgi:DNA polymerase I-like protein with 3'-5' exonuclease and polymerase domains
MTGNVRTFINLFDTWTKRKCNPMVLDIETTITPEGSASPSDGARFVIAGVWFEGVYKTYDDVTKLLTFMRDTADEYHAHNEAIILVGHNIKFDLSHLRWEREEDFEDTFDSCGWAGIWDTQQAHYLLTGQSATFNTLKDAGARYGMKFKAIDEVSESYFSKGLGADKVPENLLHEYLKDDVMDTRKLFTAQELEIGSHALRNHMFVQGWALMGYLRMESYGLPVDEKKLTELTEAYQNKTDKLNKLIGQTIATHWKLEHGELPLTNRTYSTLFFGEPGIPYKKKVLVGKYKNGKPKYKTETDRWKPEPLVDPMKIFGTRDMPNETLGYTMDEDTLDKLHKLGDSTGKLAALILQCRRDEKVLNTYLKKLGPMIRDGHIHHSINQAATGTGRTSSIRPNGQNMPDVIRTLVKKLGYKVCQWDFDALEMKVAAALSRDEQMIKDVTTGDIHYEVGKSVFGWRTPSDMDKEGRRVVKGVNFGIIYGGGPKGLAKQAGVDKSLIERLIHEHKVRYPSFHVWQKLTRNEIAGLATTGEPRFVEGTPCYARLWESFSGRKYLLWEKPLPWSPTIVNVSPQQCANYPVQGFATGDIVPLFVALTCGVNKPHLMIPINAVHDSIVGLVESGHLYDQHNRMKGCAKSLKELVSMVYRVRLPMNLTISMEYGDIWS